MCPDFPVIQFNPAEFQQIIDHLETIPVEKSSRYWEFRRSEQKLPRIESEFIGIRGLYKNSTVKPSFIRFNPRSIWFLRLRHRLHKVYTKEYKSRVPVSLKILFSEYDLVKAWYVLDLVKKLQINPARVIEIGGGVGLIGIALQTEFPNMRYINLDLNEMLPGGVLLARHVNGNDELNFLLNGFKIGNLSYISNSLLPKEHFDLGVNMVSFQEMDMEQITQYMKYLDKAMLSKSFFISINRDFKRNANHNLSFEHNNICWPTSFREVYSENSLISKYSGDEITISTKIFSIIK